MGFLISTQSSSPITLMHSWAAASQHCAWHAGHCVSWREGNREHNLCRSSYAQGRERSMKHPTLYRMIQIDGLSLFYREAGPKDAPTLLLLHGFPSASRMFEPL